MSTGGDRGADLYSVGKSIFFKQVSCANCAYAGRGKTGTDAQALLTTLAGGDSRVKLDDDEKEALHAYLSTRFKLDMGGKK